jgi:hypothetical protein
MVVSVFFWPVRTAPKFLVFFRISQLLKSATKFFGSSHEPGVAAGLR